MSVEKNQGLKRSSSEAILTPRETLQCEPVKKKVKRLRTGFKGVTIILFFFRSFVSLLKLDKNISKTLNSFIIDEQDVYVIIFKILG